MSTDTLTDNELIAEFMEVPKLEDYKGIMYDIQKTGKQIYSIRANELAYHRSWDWLMPVVHKILRNWIPTSGGWPYAYTQLQQTGLGHSIGHIHEKVVEFIKWYNQQPK